MKYKISELAKVLGVTTNTLRRYEKNGYLVPERDGSDYRRYKADDISRVAQIRLLRKCGFSHQNIEELVGNTGENICELSRRKLSEIDAEINRLKHLRHWLKDNIELMDKLNEIGDGITVRNCPPSRYVVYSDGYRLLTESDRLRTINDFMYAVDEVQHVECYRLKELVNATFIPHKCWVIKEMDIERLGIYRMVKEDKYIEIFPERKCMYGVISYPADSSDEERTEHIKNFFKRMQGFMEENRFALDDDVMFYNVNMIGQTLDSLVCMPVRDI